MSLLSLGCSELEEFKLDEDQVYRGDVIGIDDGVCRTGTICSFIRRGFDQGTALEMTFDPSAVHSAPGTLTSRNEACGATFDDTPLRPIGPLQHDALSEYEFPGGVRLRNFVFVARPETGALAGRDAMVFVSLLRSGMVELRVIAGAGAVDCAPEDCDSRARGECDYFGVFVLDRSQR